MRSWKLLLLTCALSCSFSTAVDIGGVVARVRPGELEIANLTSRPAYTFVIGREASALVDWIPCTNPQTCDGIEPRESTRVPYPGPHIEPGEKEALVYWWHLVPAAGNGFAPDSIRVGIVDLHR